MIFSLEPSSKILQLELIGVAKSNIGRSKFWDLFLSESTQLNLLMELLPLSALQACPMYVPVWKPCTNRNHGVRSYNKFIDHGDVHWQFYKIIWKANVPKKVKIFLLLAPRNKLHVEKNYWPRRN